MTDDVTQDNSESASSDFFSVEPMEHEADAAAGYEVTYDAPASEVAVLDVAETTQPPTPSLWERIRQLIRGNPDQVAERIQYLDAAIENAADTPANYVLRGELYLSLREYALARHDFQRAHELAITQFQQSDWGFLAQAMEDRALVGLQKAEKRLQANGL